MNALLTLNRSLPTVPTLRSMSGSGNSLLSAGPSRATGTYQQSATFTPTGTPPEEPDMSELMAVYAGIPQIFNPRRVAKNYERAITASNTTAAQQGRNAGLAYSNRLMQAGVMPLAAGVVEAQARRPGLEHSRELMSEKEKMELATRKEGATLSTTIANALASLRNDYTKTLADFNARQATLKMQTDANAAQTDLGYARLDQERELAEQSAALAAAKAGTDVREDVMTPGYIPSFGPITPATVNGRILPGQVISPASIAALGYGIA